MRLPFPDDFFAASLALDGLHYIRGKVGLLAELDRILHDDALWLFPHLHNALRNNTAPGTPLAPEGWARILDFLPHRIFTEEGLLTDFIERDTCDLSQRVDIADLGHARSLAAIATRRQDFWRSYDNLVRNNHDLPGKLSLNPLLETVTVGADTVELIPQWPTAEMQRECGASVEVFQERISLSAEQYDAIGNANALQASLHLVNHFIAVCVPPCYAEV